MDENARECNVIFVPLASPSAVLLLNVRKASAPGTKYCQKWDVLNFLIVGVLVLVCLPIWINEETNGIDTYCLLLQILMGEQKEGMLSKD